jgi:hypothetical protein
MPAGEIFVTWQGGFTMGVAYAFCVVLSSGPVDQQSVGDVLRVLMPSKVVWEVTRSADQFRPPPPWAANAIRGMGVNRLVAVLGQPESIQAATDRGSTTWTYVAGSDGVSVRYVDFIVVDGRVKSIRMIRETPIQGGWMIEDSERRGGVGFAF